MRKRVIIDLVCGLKNPVSSLERDLKLFGRQGHFFFFNIHGFELLTEK